ncbi:MAG: NADH-quinone oxidoreductase subunit K [Thiobacillus sp.]|nr:NADH-quinone oxidoreductase subunit K [Thiobacillus sp.]
MMLMLILSLSVLVAASVLLILSRDTLRLVVGLAMLGGAANLMVFLAGRPGSVLPPIIAAGAETLPAAANPLPQALVLTAIVIGFALLCFALVLIANLARQDARQDSDALRANEPVATDPIKPPVMEP